MTKYLKCTRLTPKRLVQVAIVLILITTIHFAIVPFFSTYVDATFKAEIAHSSNLRTAGYVKSFETRERTRRILFWPHKHNNKARISQAYCMESCSVKCDVTFNASEIESADAVDFQLTELWPENWSIGTRKTINFPSYRRHDQVWVVSNGEPPSNLFGDLRVFNGVFNWTNWYRSDATIYKPYGLFEETDEGEVELDKRNIFKEKEREVVGVISNCKDASMRYRFVDKLSKYINMDLFGKCYNKECGDPNSYKSCDNITKQYKFYLSLENTKCKDYVTEKYWGAIAREQIPIVSWDLSHINKNIPIPGSYISIHDFNSVSDLAEYIKRVSANESLYNSYFDWKKKYRLKNNSCMACLICQRLHEGVRPQVIEDFDGWVRDDVCTKVNSLNHVGTVLSEFLFWKIGI